MKPCQSEWRARESHRMCDLCGLLGACWPETEPGQEQINCPLSSPAACGGQIGLSGLKRPGRLFIFKNVRRNRRKKKKTLVRILWLIAVVILLSLLIAKKRKKAEYQEPVIKEAAPYGEVALSFSLKEVEICLGQEKEIVLNLDPVNNNQSGAVEVGAAELKFDFSRKNISLTEIEFNQEYNGSFFNKAEVNQLGEVKITVLSLSPTLPRQQFELAKIKLKGERVGEFDFSLDKDNYQIKGVRGTSDPNLSRNLSLANPQTVTAKVKVVKCKQS